MRGTATAQGSFSYVEVICGELLDDDGFLATLGTARGTLFADEAVSYTHLDVYKRQVR